MLHWKRQKISEYMKSTVLFIEVSGIQGKQLKEKLAVLGKMRAAGQIKKGVSPEERN